MNAELRSKSPDWLRETGEESPRAMTLRGKREKVFNTFTPKVLKWIESCKKDGLLSELVTGLAIEPRRSSGNLQVVLLDQKPLADEFADNAGRFDGHTMISLIKHAGVDLTKRGSSSSLLRRCEDAFMGPQGDIVNKIVPKEYNAVVIEAEEFYFLVELMRNDIPDYDTTKTKFRSLSEAMSVPDQVEVFSFVIVNKTSEGLI